MTTTTKFETGATTHAINDLILYADNTRELAELRDKIYTSCATGEISPYNMHYQFYYDFLKIVIYWYQNEFPTSCSHVINLNKIQRDANEFATLYVNDFDTWKKENGYQ